MTNTHIDADLLRAFEFAIGVKSHEKLKDVLDAGLDPNTMFEEPMGNGEKHARHIIYKVIGTSSLECLDVLLRAGADPKLAWEDHASPLMSACNRGRSDMARLIMDAGDDVNFAIKDDGWTVVHSAASNGDAQLLEELKQRGAKIDVMTANGRTPLMLSGDSEQATRWLLREIPGRIDAQDEHGTTALMEAVKLSEQKAMGVVDLFLEKGADLTLRTHDRQTSTYRNVSAVEIARMLNHHVVAEKISLFQAALQAHELIGSLRKSLGSSLS